MGLYHWLMAATEFRNVDYVLLMWTPVALLTLHFKK